MRFGLFIVLLLCPVAGSASLEIVFRASDHIFEDSFPILIPHPVETVYSLELRSGGGSLDLGDYTFAKGQHSILVDEKDDSFDLFVGDLQSSSIQEIFWIFRLFPEGDFAKGISSSGKYLPLPGHDFNQFLEADIVDVFVSFESIEIGPLSEKARNHSRFELLDLDLEANYVYSFTMTTTFVTVPEPGTWAAIVGGAMFFWVVIRRKMGRSVDRYHD